MDIKKLAEIRDINILSKILCNAQDINDTPTMFRIARLLINAGASHDSPEPTDPKALVNLLKEPKLTINNIPISVIFPPALLVAWACDCAARVLPLFESTRSNDERPHHAIKTARRIVQRARVIDIDTIKNAAIAAFHAAEEAENDGDFDHAYLSSAAAAEAATAAEATVIAETASTAETTTIATEDVALYSSSAAEKATYAQAARLYSQGFNKEGDIMRNKEEAWQRSRLLAYLLGEIKT